MDDCFIRGVLKVLQALKVGNGELLFKDKIKTIWGNWEILFPSFVKTAHIYTRIIEEFAQNYA